MKTIAETTLMIAQQDAMKKRSAADKKMIAAYRRADRAQSTDSYNRIIANAQPHRDEWTKWNEECNRIGVLLRELRATLIAA